MIERRRTTLVILPRADLNPVSGVVPHTVSPAGTQLYLVSRFVGKCLFDNQVLHRLRLCDILVVRKLLLLP